jgi:hypothetical protein
MVILERRRQAIRRMRAGRPHKSGYCAFLDEPQE